MAHWLRIAGFYLVTKDQNDKQFGFSVANRKIAGHVDGLIFSIYKKLQAQRKNESRDHPWKDTSELYFEVIPFDSEAAQRYSDRAVQILKATENNELMPCISNDPSFYLCKMCAFRKVCRGEK